MKDDDEQKNQSPGYSQNAPLIDNVEILELRGKGGMSHVYKARQKMLDRIVAVKVLSKETVNGVDAVKRFQKEAQITSNLEHPNIVKTISFGISENAEPYLIMEYLDGVSLAEILQRDRTISLHSFKEIFLPLLSALNHAHHAGLIHRDIKPGNIMLCRNDMGEEIAKLVDFGIVKESGDENQGQGLTKPGSMLGTPNYMSPEQCQGKNLDARSDLYSMACVMYEALIGEPLFSGDSMLAVLQKHSMEAPPTAHDLIRRYDIDKEIAEVILWGLIKDPALRPQTAAEFARKISDVFERITINRMPRQKKVGATSTKNYWLTGALGIGVIYSCFVLGSATLKKQLEQQKNDKNIVLKSIRKASRKDLLADDESRLKSELTRREKSNNLIKAPLIYCMDKLALVLRQEHKNAEAETLYRRASTIAEKSQLTALFMENLEFEANCCSDEGKLADAERLNKQCLEIANAKFEPNALEVGVGLYNLANFYASHNRFQEAVPLFQHAIKIEENIQFPMYRPGITSLDSSLVGLAKTYDALGKFKDAEKLFNRALTRAEDLSGKDSHDVATILLDLGTCYVDEGKTAAAELLIRRAVAIEEKSQKSKESLPFTIAVLAGFLVNQSKFDEAESLYERSMNLCQTLGDKDSYVSIGSRLADCYRLHGRKDKATKLLRLIDAHSQ